MARDLNCSPEGSAAQAARGSSFLSDEGEGGYGDSGPKAEDLTESRVAGGKRGT